MSKTTLRIGPSIDIAYRNFTLQYAINGVQSNPLEAIYASIAGCAGVYAKKSYKSMGISDEGFPNTLHSRAAYSGANLDCPRCIHRVELL